MLCHEQRMLPGSNSQTDSGTTCSYMYPKSAEKLPAASEGLHHTSPHPHQLLFYPIPWLSSGCWEVLGCRGCCSTVKGIMRQAQALGTLSAKHTVTLTTGLVQQARDNGLHELLGWAALVMKRDIRIFVRVYYPSTVIPRIQSY